MQKLTEIRCKCCNKLLAKGTVGQRLQIVRFVEYMQEVKMDNWQSFEGAQREVIKAALNYQVQYEDNLIYKF